MIIIGCHRDEDGFTQTMQKIPRIVTFSNVDVMKDVNAQRRFIFNTRERGNHHFQPCHKKMIKTRGGKQHRR
uniref:Uncharacterized protein n=1 Tax=Arion vulgaris TaxID=1028688 RepID=A0A0B6YUV0_9EUPU